MSLVMDEPLVSLCIDRAGRRYEPGATLAGQFQIDAVDPHDLSAVELSVLWHTEGKGDEDLHVHHFERFENNGDDYGQVHVFRQFETTLPGSPLSYEGAIVKVHWCVRVRLFLSHGREYVEDFPFQVGDVPPWEPPDDETLADDDGDVLV